MTELDDCPEMGQLAAFVEEGKTDAAVLAHVETCDACEEAIEALEEEILSLQIPLSEIWFREHVSCPRKETLDAYEAGKLKGEEQAYVKFHLETLGCPYCQSRLGQASLADTPGGMERARKSRIETTDATSTLLDELRDD